MGSNQGDRRKNIEDALSLLNIELGTPFKNVSSFMETEPWGFDSQEKFMNADDLCGFMTEAQKIQKAPDEKERLKAAELLGKRYGLYTEKVQQDLDMEMHITVDYGDDR